MSPAGYERLDFVLPATAEDRLVAELWASGTLGLECREAAGGSVRVVAYFDAAETAAAGAERVARGCPEARLRRHEGVPETDWLAEYRRRARPFELGRGFVVDPREPGTADDPPVPDGRRLLRLPARRAFGTGEHDTTRLVVEWIEDMDLTGASVLDVGCGSGILSLVAVTAGAGPVWAIEVDPDAVFVARDAQRLNHAGFGLAAGRAGCLRRPGGFDLLLVNVLPERIAPDLGALRSLLAAGGRALFSGLLDATGAKAEERLTGHGFATVRRRRRGEWRAVLTAAAEPNGKASC